MVPAEVIPVAFSGTWGTPRWIGHPSWISNCTTCQLSALQVSSALFVFCSPGKEIATWRWHIFLHVLTWLCRTRPTPYLACCLHLTYAAALRDSSPVDLCMHIFPNELNRSMKLLCYQQWISARLAFHGVAKLGRSLVRGPVGDLIGNLE